MILAAGLSRRMGFPKALLEWKGERYLDRLIRLFSGVCGEVIVVLRPGQEALAPTGNAVVVWNRDAERGQLSSLQTGLAAATGDCVLFCPVDYAHVAESTIAALFAQEGHDVVQPEYEGKHGHPVRIRRNVVSALLAEDPAAEARHVIRRFRRHFVSVPDPGVVLDADDPSAFATIQERLG